MSENSFQNAVAKPLAGIGLVLLWFCIFFIPLVEITTCTQGEEDTWMHSLIVFLPLSLVALGLAWLGADTQSHIKWLTLPLFALLPWAGFIVFKYIYGVSIVGHHLCAVSTGELGFNSYPRSWWSVYWGPLQLGFIILVTWLLFKYWRRRPSR